MMYTEVKCKALLGAKGLACYLRLRAFFHLRVSPVLQYFFYLTLYFDWSRKITPLSQTIRCELQPSTTW